MRPTRFLITNLYFLYIAIATLAIGILSIFSSRDWIISDWLINYQGGFVRRGFAGEIAYLLGHLFHVSPVFFVVALYLFLYAVLLLSVRALLRQTSYSLWVLALILSPATLAFPVLDFDAGFRKEILFLALLSLFAVLLARKPLSVVRCNLYLTLAIAVGTLTHESLICFTPYFVAALFISGLSTGQVLRRCSFPLAVGLVAAALSAHFAGNVQTVNQICGSLGYTVQAHANQVCSGGAINALGVTKPQAREFAWSVAQHYHFIPVYSFLAFIALLPAFAGSLRLSRAGLQREIWILWGAALLSFLGSLILFIFAVDWGRWIYIHVFSIAILMLFLEGRRLRQSAPGGEVPARLAPRPRLLATLALAVYAMSWSLPHILPGYHPYGYLALVKQMRWNTIDHTWIRPSTPQPKGN